MGIIDKTVKGGVKLTVTVIGGFFLIVIIYSVAISVSRLMHIKKCDNIAHEVAESIISAEEMYRSVSGAYTASQTELSRTNKGVPPKSFDPYESWSGSYEEIIWSVENATTSAYQATVRHHYGGNIYTFDQTGEIKTELRKDEEFWD